MAEKIVLEPGKTTNSEFKTNKIGEPITIKREDIEPCDSFRLTDELMRRIIEAENVALKNEIEANAVVVNGRKYGMLKDHLGLIPTVFGLRLETKIDMPDDWDFFIQQRPPLVLTYGDRIRAMSDEELADYLVRDVEAEAVRRSGRYLTAREVDLAVNDCVSWLKAPVEEVDNG